MFLEENLCSDMVEFYRNGEYERSVLIWYNGISPEGELLVVAYEPISPGSQFIFRHLKGNSAERMAFESSVCEFLKDHLWLVVAKRIDGPCCMPRVVAA